MRQWCSSQWFDHFDGEWWLDSSLLSDCVYLEGHLEWWLCWEWFVDDDMEGVWVSSYFELDGGEVGCLLWSLLWLDLRGLNEVSSLSSSNDGWDGFEALIGGATLVRFWSCNKTRAQWRWELVWLEMLGVASGFGFGGFEATRDGNFVSIDSGGHFGVALVIMEWWAMVV